MLVMRVVQSRFLLYCTALSKSCCAQWRLERGEDRETSQPRNHTLHSFEIIETPPKRSLVLDLAAYLVYA